MLNEALPLEDIILPNAISWWPLAWGWWVLLIASLLAITAFLYGLVCWLKHRKKLQTALKTLNDNTEGLSGSELYSAVNAWLKIQLQDQHSHALHLHGQAWADFLQQSTEKSIFSSNLLQALGQGIYQPQPTVISREECIASAHQWLLAKKKITQGGQHG